MCCVVVVVVAVSSNAAASRNAIEGDRFCGNVFDLARSVINVVVVRVGDVVAVAAVVTDVAAVTDVAVVVVARPRSTLGNGTARIFVRDRDFINLMGVEVLVCMRLISESSSSSTAPAATSAPAVDAVVDVDV